MTLAARLIPILTALCAMGAAALAAPPANPLQIELVCETRSIQPGKPFLAGLLLRHPESYHSYWSFPGIVGVPTRLKWELPPGWKAGPLQWPTPERVLMFKIKAQGFHGQKLVPIEITPPAHLEPGSQTRLAAKASWMCCGRDCNPGFERLELHVRAATTPPAINPAHSTDFSTAKASLPTLLPGWKIDASKTGDRITIQAKPTSAEARQQFTQIHTATFFTEDGLTDPNRGETLRRKTDGIVLDLAVSEFAPKPLPGELRGILVTPAGWLPGHPGRGLLVRAPLN
jgi:DsbC/DsbD-like thiol-disulfide interchange protein